MNKDSSDDTLSLADLEYIDEICQRYESALKQGHNVRIEQFLDLASAEQRRCMLKSLMLLELDLQQPRVERSRSEYEARFPQDREAVASAFHWLAHRTSTLDLSLPRRLGRYELVREIGRGGMGIVYEAHQLDVVRTVALKVIRPDRLSDAAAMERFLAERKLAARLEHPHIVRVYDVGHVGQQPYFSMELIRGKSLHELLQDRSLENQEAAALLEQLAHAVQFAHEQHGIVHRDIKPRNIMLDASGAPYLADFGLAKWLDEEQSLTETGELLGTAPYMSREQALRQKAIGTPTDIYSLGATCYATLTGRPPFQGASVLETLKQVCSYEPVAPRKLNPRIDRDLETICLACLQKDPHRRYASAGDLAAELRRFLDGRPIQRRPITVAERGYRWARRNPLIFGLSASVGGLLLVAATAGPLFAWHEAKLRHDIEVQNQKIEITNKDLKDTLGERDLQWQRAERNFQQLMKAVDRMLTRVGEEKLKNVPQMSVVRRELLEDALQFYQDQIQADGDTPAVGYQLARAHFRVGNIYRLLGRNEDSLKEYQQSIEQYQSLRKADPNSSTLRIELAASYRDQANILAALHKSKAAKASYLQVIELLQQGKDHTSLQDHVRLFELAGVYNNLSSLYHIAGNSDEALAYSDKSIEHYGLLPESQRTSPDYLLSLAGAQLNRAGYLTDADKLAESAQAAETAIELLAEHAARHRDNAELQRTFAVAHNNLARTRQRQGRLDDAVASQRKASEIHRSLVEHFPQVPEYSQMYCVELFNLASMLSQQQHHELAAENLELVIKIARELQSRFPSNPEHLHILARAHDNFAVELNDLARDGADEAHALGMASWRKLVAEFKQVPQYREGLALSLIIQFQASSTAAEMDQAIANHAEAIAELEALIDGHPNIPEYRRKIAAVYAARARLYQRRGNLAKTVSDLNTTVGVWRKLVDENQGNAMDRAGLAGSLSDMSVFSSSHEQAAALLGESIQLQRDLLTEHKHNGEIKVGLGIALLNLSLLPLAEPQVQLAVLDEARDLFSELCQTFPDQSDYAKHLKSCLNNRALLLIELERYGEAHAAAAKSVETARKWAQRQPANADWQSSVGASLNTLAQVALAQNSGDAIDLLEEAVRYQRAALAIQPQHPQFQMFLRNHLALLSSLAIRPENYENAPAIADNVAPSGSGFVEHLWACQIYCACCHLAQQDEDLAREESDAKADEYLARAKEHLEAATRLTQQDSQRTELAWLLSMCPPKGLGDAELALDLASSAAASQPHDPMSFRSLGAAFYRNGRWEESIRSHERGMKLADKQSDSAQAFFLAMAHWQGGRREIGRQFYRIGVEWSNVYGMGSRLDLAILQREAAMLLEIASPDETVPQAD